MYTRRYWEMQCLLDSRKGRDENSKFSDGSDIYTDGACIHKKMWLFITDVTLFQGILRTLSLPVT